MTGKSALGRILDTGALEAGTGPRARLSVEVPRAWLAEGAELYVTAPARLTCARCDGGGCDACGRSGALRAPEEVGARVVRASVSARADDEPASLTLRITQPFGAEHPIEQLLLEIGAADRPSTCIVRAEPARALTLGSPRRVGWPLVSFAVAVVAALLFALLGR